MEDDFETEVKDVGEEIVDLFMLRVVRRQETHFYIGQ